ncbi:MAG: hypothetical protein LCH73_01085 [Proteobacteria bacterium]|nr:hypothetical protein [Pseudomonadota bacterium]
MTAIRPGAWVWLAAAAAPALAAPAFAPTGAPAVLTVEYSYVADGKTQTKYDLHEWRVRRSATLEARLAAKAPTSLPAMHSLDAGQKADMASKQARGQAAAKDMAPMMASAEQVMAQCGEDEACIEREVRKMGAAMAGTPQLDKARQTASEARSLGDAGPLRYQYFQGVSQKGRYAIEERIHMLHGDPICRALPGARCTHDVSRQGSGEVKPAPEAKPGASPTTAMLEFDRQQNTLRLNLPIPLNVLAYTETVTTDEPTGTHEVPAPKGPQPRSLAFPKAQPDMLSVPLQGAWRSQRGEQRIPTKGEGGEGGVLTVRWTLTVP